MKKKYSFKSKEGVIVTIVSTFLLCSLSTAIPITNSSVIHENINRYSININTIKNIEIDNIKDISDEYSTIIHDYLGLNQNEKIPIIKILKDITIPLCKEIKEIINHKKTFDEIPSNLKNFILSIMELTDDIDIKSLTNENFNDNSEDFDGFWLKFERHKEKLSIIDAVDMEQITNLEWLEDFQKDLVERLLFASIMIMAGSFAGVSTVGIGPIIAAIGLIIIAYALWDLYSLFGVHETWNFMEYWKIDIILHVTNPQHDGVSDLSLDNTIKAYSNDVKEKYPNDLSLFTYNFGPIDIVDYIDDNKSEGWYLLSNWPKVTEDKTEWSKPPLPPGNWIIKFEDHPKYIFQYDEKVLPFIGARETYLLDISYPEIDTNPETPVDIETIPSEIQRFKTNVNYTFRTKTYDPDANQSLYFKFRWGDGTETPWSQDGVESNSWYTNSHIWTSPDKYEITVKARDGSGQESWWSLPLEILVEE